MRILFAMEHPGYVRNYESTLRLLAQRGHTIHLAFTQLSKQSEDRLAERLTSEFPSISFGQAPLRTDDHWSGLAWAVRLVMDYTRYLHPMYRHAHKLRERMGHKAEVFLNILHRVPLVRSAAGVRLLLRCFKALERAIPSSRLINDFVASHRPDVVLVTPLVNVASSQVEYIKSAQCLGIRTAVCVASWDNLTNKGLLRVQPDRVLVWNEFQKSEAIDLHGIRPESIVVTGAQRFDEWFDRRPSRTREEFCRDVGLPTEHPIVLFVGSSAFIAPDEVSFVREWLGSIRRAPDARVREAGVLIRPHPQNADQWLQANLSAFGDVAIWPRGGAHPVGTETKADFYDSLFHSAAVVGVNTSALIEAGIVGRRVYTILAPQFAGTQRGTLHFQYLEQAGGGLLHVAASLDEHVGHLSTALDGDADAVRSNRHFLETFIRPHGLDVPCTPILTQAIESLAAMGAASPHRDPLWSHPLRLALLGLRLVLKDRFNGPSPAGSRV